MKFFCLINEPIEQGYKILLNKENINLMPDKDVTLRRIYINANLVPGQMIYVNKSDLLPGGKLVVEQAFVLNELDILGEITLDLDPDIKEKIVSKEIKPIDILQHVS